MARWLPNLAEGLALIKLNQNTHPLPNTSVNIKHNNFGKAHAQLIYLNSFKSCSFAFLQGGSGHWMNSCEQFPRHIMPFS